MGGGTTVSWPACRLFLLVRRPFSFESNPLRVNRWDNARDSRSASFLSWQADSSITHTLVLSVVQMSSAGCSAGVAIYKTDRVASGWLVCRSECEKAANPGDLEILNENFCKCVVMLVDVGCCITLQFRNVSGLAVSRHHVQKLWIFFHSCYPAFIPATTGEYNNKRASNRNTVRPTSILMERFVAVFHPRTVDTLRFGRVIHHGCRV